MDQHLPAPGRSPSSSSRTAPTPTPTRPTCSHSSRRRSRSFSTSTRRRRTARCSASRSAPGSAPGRSRPHVYFGPLLVGVLTAIAANLALLAFLAVAMVWGVTTLVKSTAGTGSKAASKSLRRR